MNFGDFPPISVYFGAGGTGSPGVPEPITLLVLAAGTMLARRRRA